MRQLATGIDRGWLNLGMQLKLARAAIAAKKKSVQLPPGRLCIPSRATLADQKFLLKQAEEHGQIFKVWIPHKMTTCIVGHEMARRFLVENEGKVRAATTDLSPLFPLGFLRALDGPVHLEYRRLFLDAFRETSLEPHLDTIRKNVRGSLESLARLPQPVVSGDVRRALKTAITANFMQTILGVSIDSPLYQDFVEAYDEYAPDGPFIVVRPHNARAYRTLHALAMRQIATIKSADEAKPSLLRHLIRSDSLDETTLGNLIQMVEVTRFDLNGLWCWILKILSGRPDIVERVRSNPPTGDSGLSIAQAVVREVLRMEQSELLHRVVKEDIVFEGYLVPKDSRVRICIWEAHHDPRRFPEPFWFDCERFMKAKVPPEDYSPFGLDRHRCPGADWTYDLSAIFVNELVHGYDWTVIADGPPVPGKFHFEPSQEFTISFKTTGAEETAHQRCG